MIYYNPKSQEIATKLDLLNYEHNTDRTTQSLAEGRGCRDEAEAAAKSVCSNNQLATKEDTARIEGELKLVKWMLALVIVVLVVPLI